MKLTAVRDNRIRQNNSDNNKQSKNINFIGIADFATTFWNLVDAGGRGAQFTVEDMLGTNIPRTYKGAMSGYEYTGEINWASVKQEGIREFLTGPTMVCAPIAILAAATRLCGKTSATHCENITNLSHLALFLREDNLNKDAFANEFLEKVIDDMLTQSAQSLDETAKADISKKLTKNIKEYGNHLDAIKNADSRAAKKAAKQNAKNLLDEMALSFEKTLKKGNKSYKNLNFQNAKYSIGKGIVGQTNFKNYIKYINAYIDDYAKSNTLPGNKELIKISKDAIQSFEKTWLGKRMIIASSMIILTGVLMSMIPKLYTLASGGVNPNAANIYNEAKKREGE